MNNDTNNNTKKNVGSVEAASNRTNVSALKAKFENLPVNANTTSTLFKPTRGMTEGLATLIENNSELGNTLPGFSK
ncbi:MAG: hypothetical protein V4471_07120 [Pseudomonadota bacterium]